MTAVNQPPLQWEPSAVLSPFGTRNDLNALTAIKTLIDNSNYWYVQSHDVGTTNTFIEIRQRRSAAHGSPDSPPGPSTPARDLMPDFRIIISTGTTITNTYVREPGWNPFSTSMSATSFYVGFDPYGGSGSSPPTPASLDPWATGGGMFSRYVRWGEFQAAMNPPNYLAVDYFNNIFMIESEEAIAFFAHKGTGSNSRVQVLTIGDILDPLTAEESSGDLYPGYTYLGNPVYRRPAMFTTNGQYWADYAGVWETATFFPSTDNNAGYQHGMYFNPSGGYSEVHKAPKFKGIEANVAYTDKLQDATGAYILLPVYMFDWGNRYCVGRLRQWGAWSPTAGFIIYSDGASATIACAVGNDFGSRHDGIGFAN